MKNKFFGYIALVAIVAALSACEKSQEVYHAGNGLNFFYENASDTLRDYSFVYGPSAAMTDTIWVKTETIGPLSDKAREIAFEQVLTNGKNAVAGTDYIAFDDTSIKSYYSIPAGKAIASVPVIIKRTATLKTSSVTLLIRIKNNEYFKLTNPQRSTVKIVFTDQLSKPSRWAYYCSAYFGTYGPVKHQFLIEQTGKKWDDDYLSNVLGFTSSSTYTNGTNSNYDDGFCSYLEQVLAQKLAVYNAARTAQGLGVLKEADGTIVTL